MKNTVLVTGAAGLVGTDLLLALRADPRLRVVSTDISKGSDTYLDVRDQNSLTRLFTKYRFSQVYHLAGLLSVGSEANPDLAWETNLGGLKNVLDLAVKHHSQVFWPSSIAVFGPTTPKVNTPQHTILEPTTIYGTTKVAGELLCQYYWLRYKLDVRSLRYPGLIAWKAPPGNGTTEYSVHIFHHALTHGRYNCFLGPDTRLPMMYIDDAITGTLKLMQAPAKSLTIRTSYNFSALSFTPKELASEISRHLPDFDCGYTPDHRQAIADSWPQTIDDSTAQSDWGWKPAYNLSHLVKTMVDHLKPQYVKN